jgi:hypothetical protein
MMKSTSCVALAALLLAVVPREAAAQAYKRTGAADATRPGGGTAATTVLRLHQIEGIGARGLVRTPEYTTSVARGRTPPREWAQVTVTFDTEPEWMDEVTLQYYVLLYNKATDEQSLLRGSIVHVEVARGRAHMSAVYLRPGTLDRYGNVIAVAVEAMYKGNLVATESQGRQGNGKPLPEEWWKKFTGPTKEGYVLSKAQTPFAFVNADDYEAVR